MKYLLVFIFIPFLSLAQYPETKKINGLDPNYINNFEIIENNIFWRKVFEGDANKIENIKIKDNKGTNCNISNYDNVSIFMNEDFTFDYKIEQKDNRYRISVYNIRFNNSIQLNFGGVQTTRKDNSFEFFMIRKKDNKLRKNQTCQNNLICLNHYLTEIFKIKPKPVSNNW